MRPLIVCDIGLNHNGSMELAKELIDMAKFNGFDYVKFQKRTVDKVYSQEELARPKKTHFGETYGDEKYGLEFGFKEYDEIDTYCKEVGIEWFASVWDVESVDFITQFDVPFIKLASCCCNHIELLEKVASTGKPVILSVGMSTPAEVRNAIQILGENLAYILSTTSIYPCSDEMVNLNKIRACIEEYGDYATIGFSSHSKKIIFPVVASLLGARMVEFHITMDHKLEGPDHAASVAPLGCERIANHIQSIEHGMGSGSLYPFPEELEKGKKYSWRQK